MISAFAAGGGVRFDLVAGVQNVHDHFVHPRLVGERRKHVRFQRGDRRAEVAVACKRRSSRCTMPWPVSASAWTRSKTRRLYRFNSPAALEISGPSVRAP